MNSQDFTRLISIAKEQFKNPFSSSEDRTGEKKDILFFQDFKELFVCEAMSKLTEQLMCADLARHIEGNVNDVFNKR